jgi:hypothetical protein
MTGENLRALGLVHTPKTALLVEEAAEDLVAFFATWRMLSLPGPCHAVHNHDHASDAG